MGRSVWTLDQIRALGVATTLPTAASILGIGRSLAYELAATNQFPVPVIRAGNRLLIPVRPLLQLLRLDDPTPGAATGGLDDGAGTSVDVSTHPADSR